MALDLLKRPLNTAVVFRGSRAVLASGAWRYKNTATINHSQHIVTSNFLRKAFRTSLFSSVSLNRAANVCKIGEQIDDGYCARNGSGSAAYYSSLPIRAILSLN